MMNLLVFTSTLFITNTLLFFAFVFTVLMKTHLYHVSIMHVCTLWVIILS